MIEDSNITHSDHEVLLWNVICYLKTNTNNLVRKKWNYSDTDIPAMCDFLVNIDWDNVLSSDNVNDNWIALKNKISEAQSKFITLQPNKSNSKSP